jgi:hypothetical protein
LLVALALSGCWFEDESPLPPLDCDLDGDGHEATRCGGDDCDDNDMQRYPGNLEECEGTPFNGQLLNAHDEDCNPCTVAYRGDSLHKDGDIDNDGFISAACTNPLPPGADTSQCRLHEVVIVLGDVVRGNDCDDGSPSEHPFQPEVCNHIDDNCDGAIDDGVQIAGFADSDHDAEGSMEAVNACAGDIGFSIYPTDCDDANPAIRNGSLRCAPNTGANAFERCVDGFWTAGTCGLQATCRVQPNGTGICL